MAEVGTHVVARILERVADHHHQAHHGARSGAASHRDGPPSPLPPATDAAKLPEAPRVR